MWLVAEIGRASPVGDRAGEHVAHDVVEYEALDVVLGVKGTSGARDLGRKDPEEEPDLDDVVDKDDVRLWESGCGAQRSAEEELAEKNRKAALHLRMR